MHPVMELLAAGVPLSLLCDLAEQQGPDSELIARVERRALSGRDGRSLREPSAVPA